MSLPEIGAVVAGRYRLESPIGSGASASVFRAFDSTLVRSVAIKFLYAGSEQRRAELVERFLREARLAAAVEHPNVMRTLDFGTSDGRPFLVMELLQGQTLATRMACAPPVDPVEAVEIMLGVLAGLGAVHRAGIVHRDLKPENVYLAEEAALMRPKLMDFGVSRVARPEQLGVRSVLTSQDGMIIGTPEYMSPEQARATKEVDARSDLYSAGVLLFELLTESLPYEAETMADLLVCVAKGGAPSPGERRPGLPRELCAVVTQAMAHDRGRRFSDARAMARALCIVMGMPAEAETRGTVQRFVRAANVASGPPRAALLSSAPRAASQAQRLLADAETVSAPLAAQPVTFARREAPRMLDAISLAELGDVREAKRSDSLPIDDRWADAKVASVQTQVAGLQGAVPELQLDPAVGARVQHVVKHKRPAVGVASRAVHRRRVRVGGGSPLGWLIAAVVVGLLGYRWLGAHASEPWLQRAEQVVGRATGNRFAGAERITLRLQGVPADAQVVLDGSPVPMTELELPADAALHLVEVRARGKRTWSASFEAVRDHTFAVLLIEQRPALRRH